MSSLKNRDIHLKYRQKKMLRVHLQVRRSPFNEDHYRIKLSASVQLRFERSREIAQEKQNSGGCGHETRWDPYIRTDHLFSGNHSLSSRQGQKTYFIPPVLWFYSGHPRLFSFLHFRNSFQYGVSHVFGLLPG